MIENQQSDVVRHTHHSALSILLDGQEYNSLSTPHLTISDVIVSLHDIARRLPSNEASQIRTIANNLGSKLKDFRAHYSHSNFSNLKIPNSISPD